MKAFKNKYIRITFKWKAQNEIIYVYNSMEHESQRKILKNNIQK